MKNKIEESERKSESFDEMSKCQSQNCKHCSHCCMMCGKKHMQGSTMKNGRQEPYADHIPGPSHGHNHDHNHDQNYGYLMNQPVGVSLKNGQGVSGILCSISNREIFLLQYLYHSQFATKHYSFNQIQDIYPFPKCYKHKPGVMY